MPSRVAHFLQPLFLIPSPLEKIEPATVSTSPSDPEVREEVERVLETLGHLSVRERTAFVLRVIGERSYEEIAALLDCSTGTAGSLIHRARAHLAERLLKPVQPSNSSPHPPTSSASPLKEEPA